MAAKKKAAKRGPTPDRVKIEGDWAEAVKKALEKKRPEGGWPTSPETRERPKKNTPKE